MMYRSASVLAGFLLMQTPLAGGSAPSSDSMAVPFCETAQPFAPRGAPQCPDSISTLRGYAADDGVTVDLMVYYTHQARDAAGGDAAISQRIDIAVSRANTALANSLIQTRLRVIRKAPVIYAESGNGLTDLIRLTEPNDGILDHVHGERDTYGADLVSLWVRDLNVGGTGFQLYALGPDDDGRYGFTVCRQSFYDTELLAHEVGHNFGCQHDRDNQQGVGFYPYSYGYREPGNLWHDLMAYDPGLSIPYYSNPNVFYNGPPGNPGPTGIAEGGPLPPCDNARTIINTSWTLANFRPSTLSVAPAARLYVRPAAPLGGDGASWATANRDVQSAISTAVQSRGVVTEIWCAAGTYKPDRGRNDRLLSFRLANGVSVYGGFVGTETLLSQRNIAANPTILSGDIGVPGDHSDNTYHVIEATDLSESAVLDGFTITLGRATAAYPHESGGGLRAFCGKPTIRNCSFVNNSANTAGGGAVLHRGSAGVFSNCTFSGNTAFYGGGANCSDETTTRFENCVFMANSSNGYGGAFQCDNSRPYFAGCLFEQNTCPNSGAVEHVNGSAGTFANCMFVENSADWNGAFGSYAANPVLIGCTFTGNTSINGGGAITAGSNSLMVISNCTVTENTAGFGGGVYCWGGSNANITGTQFSLNEAGSGAGLYTYAASPTLANCTFMQNQAGSDFNGVGGGATFAADSHPAFTDCLFDRNDAACCGGGTVSYDSAATMLRCTFIGNTSYYGGGGVWDESASATQLVNCRLLGNFAQFSGGGIHNSNNSASMLINCVLSGNRAGFYDGAASWNVTGAHPTFINCTINNNAAGWNCGGVYNDAATATLANCVLWGNTDPSGSGEPAQIRLQNGATATISYSNLQGWTNTLGGSGNSGGNPLFVDADGADNVAGTLDDNPRLQANSPCIDAGRNSDLPPEISTDLAPAIRFVEVAAIPNTGVGSPPLVDRGAYEIQVALMRDMNCDGLLNASDVPAFALALIDMAAFQSTYPSCNPLQGDMNADGLLDGADVQAFITAIIGP